MTVSEDIAIEDQLKSPADAGVDNMTFAEEVKADRLKSLSLATMVVGLTFALFLLTFGTMTGAINVAWFASFIVLIGGAFASMQLLQRTTYEVASWTYALATVAGVSFMLFGTSDTVLQVIPFLFPIIIFITGLLLSPSDTFMLTGIAAVAVLVVPWLGSGEWFPQASAQIFSIIFTTVSAALAAQVTGELYQITQWALDNYRRERQTNNELFEKRNELRRSLARAEALSDQIRETNKELEIAHHEAEEAKHFRGQFLANMSHELRTPLNAIIGFSETMLQFPIMYDNQELPPAYERDLNQIYNSGRQLLHVINDILDLAKVDAGKLEIHLQQVETEAITNAVMSTAKGLLGSKPVKLHSDVPDEMPIAWADETRLRQVLLNLYSNACKYTDEGSITLHCTVHDDTQMIEFAVADTGVGIDPEFHDQLFQEFQQAKHGGRDPRSGSGLGLAISKQLLDLMGGDIWMESTPGNGSTFWFTIPRYHGQDQDASSTQAHRTVSVAALNQRDQQTSEEVE
jgi:signal transduction histidine kinase